MWDEMESGSSGKVLCQESSGPHEDLNKVGKWTVCVSQSCDLIQLISLKVFVTVEVISFKLIPFSVVLA